MGQPAAKLGDKVQGTDIHIIMVPSPGGPVPTPTPHPFSGTIISGTSSNVVIEGKPAATVNSMATNLPPHIPMGPGPFMKPPTNQGTIMMGSGTVFVNGKPATRMGEIVRTCNDPIDAPTGSVVCGSTVLIGGPSAPALVKVGGGTKVAGQQYVREEAREGQRGKGSLVVLCTDEEGSPVVDCDYEVILPDGRRKRGKTNAEGKINESEIDPGDCEVHLFPK